MAITIKALDAGKHSVVETNHVSAVRTGDIAAQHVAEVALDNGMAVSVDQVGRKVKFAEVGMPVYLHASDEQIYEDHLGRDSFHIRKGDYPKCLRLKVGDIFETDAAVAGEYTAGDIVSPNEAGLWAKGAVTITGFEAKVVGEVYLPNGKTGLKIAVTAIA